MLGSELGAAEGLVKPLGELAQGAIAAGGGAVVGAARQQSPQPIVNFVGEFLGFGISTYHGIRIITTSSQG